MELVAGILIVEGLIVLGLIGLIIYLIIRRLEKKRQETFEKRDN
jgi:preprotein translocase subunit YajC